MRLDVVKIRALIESADLEDARRVIRRMIRLGARRRLYFYAARNFITDFDSVLLTQRHRNVQQVIIDAAQAKATEAQAATTVVQLLIIFDAIADNL